MPPIRPPFSCCPACWRLTSQVTPPSSPPRFSPCQHPPGHPPPGLQVCMGHMWRMGCMGCKGRKGRKGHRRYMERMARIRRMGRMGVHGTHGTHGSHAGSCQGFPRATSVERLPYVCTSLTFCLSMAFRVALPMYLMMCVAPAEMLPLDSSAALPPPPAGIPVGGLLSSRPERAARMARTGSPLNVSFCVYVQLVSEQSVSSSSHACVTYAVIRQASTLKRCLKLIPMAKCVLVPFSHKLSSRWPYLPRLQAQAAQQQQNAFASLMPPPPALAPAVVRAWIFVTYCLQAPIFCGSCRLGDALAGCSEM